MPLAAQERTIPLLISDHHADHMEFFFSYGMNTSATMIVLDAHTDTVANNQRDTIRDFASAGDFSKAGELAGNHNWIDPLAPFPLKALIWISTIQGYPRSDKLSGFQKSMTSWDEQIPAIFMSVEELKVFKIPESNQHPESKTLFISIDLDFFYSEDYGPHNISAVFDTLFTFSSNWNGFVVWAISLSRPWLPYDNYAWELLAQSLSWLLYHQEFQAPKITLFNSPRIDTSFNAQAFRAEGKEIPVLQEENVPKQIKEFLRELSHRK